MRQYPIWVNVQGTDRQNQPSHGARDRLRYDVYVGTNARNSHEFAKIEIARLELPGGETEFALYVGNEMIKRGTLRGKTFEIDCDLEASRQGD